MDSLKRLHNFFRAEVETEVQSGFARLERIPDSRVASKLRYYRSLSKADRVAFLYSPTGLAALWFVVGAPKMPPTDHPFFDKWSAGHRWSIDWGDVKSVPYLRAMVHNT